MRRPAAVQVKVWRGRGVAAFQGLLLAGGLLAGTPGLSAQAVKVPAAGSAVSSASVAACKTAMHVPCATPQKVHPAALMQDPGLVSILPNPPQAYTPETLSVQFGPTTPSFLVGAPSGLATFAEGTNVFGSPKLLLDTTAQLTTAPAGTPVSSNFTASEGGAAFPTFIADFNHDGVQDSMFLDEQASTFHILLGQPPYATDHPVTPTGLTCDSINGAAVADFNGDGFPDIAFVCTIEEVGSIYLMTGVGDGSTFNAPTLVAPGDLVATADFNKDGKADLVAVVVDDISSIQVLFGDSQGHFTAGPAATMLNAYADAIYAADLSGDGAPDLVLLGDTEEAYTTMYVYQGDGAGNFGAPVYTSPAQFGFYSTVAIAPLKTGQYPSLMVTTQGILGGEGTASADESSPGTVTVYPNLGTAAITFGSPTTLTVDGLGSAVAGDFNGDGLVDLATSSFATGIAVAVGDGTGNFNYSTYPGLVDTSANASLSLLVGAVDENGDGYSDLRAYYTAQTYISSRHAGVKGRARPSYTGVLVAYTEQGYVTAGTASATLGTMPTFAPGFHTIQVTTPATETLAAGHATLTFSVAGMVTPIVLGSLSTSTANLGDPATTITLTGTFTQDAVVEVNGTAIATTYVNGTTLTAVIPASDFLLVGTLQITVYDAGGAQTSNALPFTVVAPAVSVVFTGPATTMPAQQPALSLQLGSAYPVVLSGTMVITFTPAAGLPDDPAIQFASPGTSTTDPTGRTFGFTIPASTTTPPAVMLQSGSVEGTITVTLTLSAGGADVTPSSLQPVVIAAPAAVPGISSVALSTSGKVLTVVVRGYSNTREVSQALFQFTPSSGHSLKTTELTIDDTSIFTQWYSSETSDQYGSTFTYTQTFNLDADATVVGGVTVTLTNTVGNSAAESTP